MKKIKFRAWDIRKEVLFDDKKMNLYSCRDDDNMIVMQFTGLKDKNGKEIYESGIVMDEDKDLYEVIKVDWRICLKRIKTGKLFDYPVIQNIKVIGNIYENPELLVGEGK